MQETWTRNVIWWITAVESPALAGLFWLIWRNRRDTQEAIDDARHESETGLSYLREALGPSGWRWPSPMPPFHT